MPPVQRNERAIESGELIEPAARRVKGLGVDAAALQRRENARTAVQRDLALG
jgi:hypothetical protein